MGSLTVTAFARLSLFLLLQNPPVVVKIVGPKKDPTGLTGLTDVLIGALGLSGVFVLCAVVLGVVFAAVLFYVRSRSGHENET